MIDALNAIVIDATIRSAQAVEAHLVSHASAGTPWVDG